MKVGELMLRDLTSVEENDTIRTLVEALATSETPSITVTDDNSCPVGIISEEDVLIAAMPRYMAMLQSASYVPNLEQLLAGLRRIAEEPVHKYMTRKVILVDVATEDLHAADLMLRHKLRLLPVVAADGGLVGVVRRADLFKRILCKGKSEVGI